MDFLSIYCFDKKSGYKVTNRNSDNNFVYISKHMNDGFTSSVDEPYFGNRSYVKK